MCDDEEMEEEFIIWKKNTPFLYDFILSHSLEWPSLTVQFLSSPPITGVHVAKHTMILATHTSDACPNYLMLAHLHYPIPHDDHDDDPEDFESRVDIVQKIYVDGEVNRARYMPQKPSVVAAKTSGCDVYVFDCDKRPMIQKGEACNPDLRLKGHDKEGYGLSWSPFKEGYLLSGSDDCKICLWDASSRPQNKILQATNVYEAHDKLVSDVSWHLKDQNLFGSVSDDCRLIIWDLRTNKPQQSVQAHEKEVNYVSFNPYNEWVLATASSDTTVGLFDMRKLDSPLHTLGSHEEEVFQVEWHPNHETVLASSAGDRRLMVWDLNRIGDEQLEGEAEDGPPELLFSHAGHKAKISDFSWNINEPWLISSVAEDNTIQVWQMAESIYRENDDDDVVQADGP